MAIWYSAIYLTMEGKAVKKPNIFMVSKFSSIYWINITNNWFFKQHCIFDYVLFIYSDMIDIGIKMGETWAFSPGAHR